MPNKEHELLAMLRAERGNPALRLMIELLQVRMNRFAEQRIDSDDQRLAGRACECRDLIKRLLTVDPDDMMISSEENPY